MDIVDTKEKWTRQIRTVTIGATAEQGGTRDRSITVGGETTLPFMTTEGQIPNRPVIAGIVCDVVPEGWPDFLTRDLGDVVNSPAEWAQKLVEECSVDMISLKLIGADPNGANRSAAETAETVKAVLEAVKVLLIFWGCDDLEKDNDVLMECSQAAKGERCLVGPATEDNYRTLGAIGTADKHAVIAEAPVDINIGKQVNILLQDAGFSLDDVVMCQTTAALGYGFDYVYTIFERVRIAGLKGDELMALPQIANCGWEVWKVKEAFQDEDLLPGWGKVADRGPMWEITTATGYVHAGADIVTLAHPRSIAAVRQAIDELMTQ